MLGLILSEIVYNVKKKLGCIFEENHNSETIILKRGQLKGLVMSCIVTQEEQGQVPVKRKEDMPSVTEQSNDMGTHIGGASVGNEEKAGWKADSVQSIENRWCYETEEKKRKFIRESFQLDMNALLNADSKLKEAVIKLFLDNFKVLAMHPKSIW